MKFACIHGALNDMVMLTRDLVMPYDITLPVSHKRFKPAYKTKVSKILGLVPFCSSRHKDFPVGKSYIWALQCFQKDSVKISPFILLISDESLFRLCKRKIYCKLLV